MARVRQGCLASVFLFSMAFDPAFRWLHGSVSPRDLAAPEFLQPAPCAYADDFAVATPILSLLDARVVYSGGQCRWPETIKSGNDSCQTLLEWVSTSCEECREMKIVKHAKSMDCTTENFTQRARTINETSKILVERLIDFNFFCLISVLGYIGSISALDEAALKEESHALQCTAARSSKAKPTEFLRTGSVCGLGSDLCGIRVISLAARFRTAACSGSLVNGLAEIRAAREYDGASFECSHSQKGEKVAANINGI